MHAIRNRLRPILLAATGLSFLVIGFCFWKQERLLQQTRSEVVAEGSFAVRRAFLRTEGTVSFETLPGPAGYRSAVFFQGLLYAGGGAGVYAYDQDGNVQRRWRPGIELPPAVVTEIAATASELWIGTGGAGLLRFDGTRLEQIEPQDARMRHVTALLPLSTGRVAIGTKSNGVLVFDGRSLRPFHTQIPRVQITALAGTDADLWIGTFDQGLVRCSAGTTQGFGAAEGLPDSHIVSLGILGETVYAGTSVGVVAVSGGKMARVVAESVYPQALLPTGDELLIGTLEEGVVSVAGRRQRLRGGVTQGVVNSFLVTKTGALAVMPDRIVDVKTGLNVIGPQPGQLADRNVSALAVDTAGRLWVGYFDRGLDLVAGGNVRHFEDERIFCVNRIVPAPNTGETAVATANGLVYFDRSGKPGPVLRRAEGLISDHVTDLVFTEDGAVAATPRGLTWFRNGTTESMYAFHGLVNNHVYALGWTGGKLMAGTLGGASLVEQGLVKANYTTANAPLRQNWISAIATADGSFYAGTYGAGVLALRPSGEWQSFGDLPRDLVINLGAMLSSGDRVYAGSLDRGLWVFSKKNQRWRGVTAELPSLNVTALAADRAVLYVGTENGLVRIPEDRI